MCIVLEIVNHLVTLTTSSTIEDVLWCGTFDTIVDSTAIVTAFFAWEA